MTKVLVGGNDLRDEGTIILCDALRGSTVGKVQELGLSSNGIGPDGAKAVAALCAAMRRFNISTQRAWADAFIDRARAYALKVAPPAVADPEPQWVAQPADEFHVMQDSLAFVDMQDVWM